MGIKNLQTAGPQTNGALEHIHGTLEPFGQKPLKHGQSGHTNGFVRCQHFQTLIQGSVHMNYLWNRCLYYVKLLDEILGTYNVSFGLDN